MRKFVNCLSLVRQIFQATCVLNWPRVFALSILLLLPGTRYVNSQQPDLQLWMPVQFIHTCGEKWTVSMQTELRLKDDISEFSQLVYKPALNHHFNDTWTLSMGYKFIEKHQDSNEQDLWQEIHFNRKFRDLVSGFQVRLEERVIDDIPGIIPRLRFLQHLSHPLGEGPNYLTGSGAIRLNLDNKGEGPVSGFEQSRIYAALGRHLNQHTQFEVGYLWRYEFERVGDNLNDHAIHLQLVYNTRAKKSIKPAIRDRYR